jgi:hypothetical protein
LQSVGDENMDEEEEVKTMSSSDDTFNMSAKELRKFKKKERKVANSSQLTSLHGVSIFFLIFLLPVFSSPMCELISLQEGIISHSLC